MVGARAPFHHSHVLESDGRELANATLAAKPCHSPLLENGRHELGSPSHSLLVPSPSMLRVEKVDSKFFSSDENQRESSGDDPSSHSLSLLPSVFEGKKLLTLLELLTLLTIVLYSTVGQFTHAQHVEPLFHRYEGGEERFHAGWEENSAAALLIV